MHFDEDAEGVVDVLLGVADVDFQLLAFVGGDLLNGFGVVALVSGRLLAQQTDEPTKGGARLLKTYELGSLGRMVGTFGLEDVSEAHLLVAAEGTDFVVDPSSPRNIWSRTRCTRTGPVSQSTSRTFQWSGRRLLEPRQL